MPPTVQVKAMVGFLTEISTHRASSLCEAFPKKILLVL